VCEFNAQNAGIRIVKIIMYVIYPCRKHGAHQIGNFFVLFIAELFAFSLS